MNSKPSFTTNSWTSLNWVLAALALALIVPARAQTLSDADWVSLGSGMNGHVYALAVSRTNLYVGGYFTNAGGVTANRIAEWDGTAWSALGSGVNGEVSVLAVSGTNLYAGGNFTTAGRVAARGIAQWNGSAWSALGSGVGGNYSSVSALAVIGTDLYAGGYFNAAGGMPANSIAKWNGSAWSALGSGMDGAIGALAVSGTNLYAGGNFTTAGGVTARGIAQWNGSAWSALGSGMNGTVSALAVSGTNLYAGGVFTNAGGVPADNIARWNGTAWSALDSGIGGNAPYVYALAVSGTDLYAGGYFTNAGGVPANRIAKWDGTAWSALGSGVMGGLLPVVNALAADGARHLLVGGAFSVAGTNLSSDIAQANVGRLPVIVASPASLAVAVGATADFQVAATGSPPLVYQWVSNSTTAIAGATNAFLTLTNVQLTQAGTYSVTVSNLYGAVTSAPAVLTVTGVPPVIVSSPASLAVPVGATADFQVAATGSPPLVYQWVSNSTTAIAGATNAFLSLTNVQLTQAGTYSVTVSNLYGAVTSAPAVLHVIRPAIGATNSEADLRAAMALGGTVTFAFDGTITLTQAIWSLNNTVLDGSGHQVTISGGRSTQVFYVATGSLTLIHLTISNGRTSDGANGMYIYPGATSGGPGKPGGGIYNAATLILRDCVVTANSTGSGGLGYSAQYLSSLGGSGGSGGGIYNTGTLLLSNCIVSGNSTGYGSSSGGGGTPDDYHPVGGNGGLGGGIYNAGTLCLVNSTVNGNTTGKGADDPIGGPGATGGDGGGIWSSGNMVANECTFSGNSAGAGGAGGIGQLQGGSGGTGGKGGAICGTGYFALTNCTVAGNSTGAGGAGGSPHGVSGQWGSGAGIYGQTNLDLASCTIAFNSAGGGVADANGTARLLNSIVALNMGYPPDVWGVFLSLGHNLIGTTNGSLGFPGQGDQVGSGATPLNPKVGPLANNGGPTLTMALLPGSPAIDAGNTSLAPATDQRGSPRPAGLAADIGAFEYGSVGPSLAVSLSGATGLNILASGSVGQSCRLLSSTDLSSWVPIATNCIGSDGTILFHDNCAPGGACRFYLLVTP